MDDRTARGWPLPSPDNLLEEDVMRLRGAINAIDGGLTALETNSTEKITALQQNIVASMTDLTPGSSALPSGRVYLVYE